MYSQRKVLVVHEKTCKGQVTKKKQNLVANENQSENQMQDHQSEGEVSIPDLEQDSHSVVKSISV